MMGVTTVVSGKPYQEFIPFYIYSILRSYPDYHVKVFCKGKLGRGIRKSLSAMGEMGHFEVIENSFKEYPNTKSNNKACRWLLDSHHLGEFDHVYVGDVDFFILPETPSLLEQHIQHHKFTGSAHAKKITKRVHPSQQPE